MKSANHNPRPFATGIIMVALLLAGCDEGPVGPEGPPGNANVFSVNFDFSMASAIVNGTVASEQFDVPGITPSVVDDGAVLMFFREEGTWTSMPFTYGVESEDPALDAVDYTVTLGFGYDDGFLEPFYESSIDILDLPADAVPDRQMKAVIIDGFPFGKTSIDLSNYEAVKAAFSLKE